MRIIILIICLFCSVSCSRKQEDPIVTQMKVRTMQTRIFVGHSAKQVAKEIVASLQDEGYIVKNVNTDLGLLTAERDINIEKFSSKFWAYLFSGKGARWKKHSVIEMTSNITEEKGKTSLRVNFLLRVFDNLGRVVEVEQILDEEAYSEFFNKIQNGLITKKN